MPLRFDVSLPIPQTAPTTAGDRPNRAPLPRRSLLSALLLTAFAPIVGAQGRPEPRPCTELRVDAPLLGSSVRLIAEDSVPPEIVERAIQIWRGCGSAGRALPRLVRAGLADRELRVHFDPGSSASSKCGKFAGRTITLYGSALSGTRRPMQCGDLAQNLAHEIGHAFGLVDSPPRATCRSNIMAKLDPGNRVLRAVTPEECALVDRRWLTAWERDAPTIRRPGAWPPTPLPTDVARARF